VRSYYIILFKRNKSKEYRNFYAEDSPTYILIILDALAHNTDIPDIIRFIIYSYHPNKSLNIILQRFGQAARRNSITKYTIILIKD